MKYEKAKVVVMEYKSEVVTKECQANKDGIDCKNTNSFYTAPTTKGSVSNSYKYEDGFMG